MKTMANDWHPGFTNAMARLNRIRRAIRWNRSFDYLNPGFGQHNFPDWMAPGKLFEVVTSR